ncbi:MAG: hypothetical protein ACRDH6_08940 [Actinomycetota bacterium]
MTGPRVQGGQLERRLGDLGRGLAYPEARDLAPMVVARIRQMPAPTRRLVPVPMFQMRRTAVLAAAAALLVAGAATAGVFAIRGVKIRVLPTPPVVPSIVPGENLALGEPVTLAEARSGVEFSVLIPGAFGAPDQVFLDRLIPGGRATLVYLPRQGLPKDRLTGLGMILTEFVGSTDEDFILKGAGPGTSVDQVQVAGAPGLWIEGDPHSVLYRDQRGQPLGDSIRLAGNVLLWQAGDLTLRLEADISRSRAIRIAESVG